MREFVLTGHKSLVGSKILYKWVNLIYIYTYIHSQKDTKKRKKIKINEKLYIYIYISENLRIW